MALVFSEGRQEHLELNDFEAVSIEDIELAVTESSRRNTPMTLIRGGEERDYRFVKPMALRTLPLRCTTLCDSSLDALFRCGHDCAASWSRACSRP
jgi:hypothetical protein